VDVDFKTEKLRKQCNEDKEMVKVHGPCRAQKLRQRLDDLRAAPNLYIMRSLPGRCHELKGDKKGELAVDLDHPYRLIFEPVGENIHKVDGGLDWNAVTSIRILSIEDYHE
jgi:proteic killer suppression protein